MKDKNMHYRIEIGKIATTSTTKISYKMLIPRENVLYNFLPNKNRKYARIHLNYYIHHGPEATLNILKPLEYTLEVKPLRNKLINILKIFE